MEQTLRAKFEGRYAQWKDHLLDLTPRNRLLNFRPTKVSTIQITAPDVSGLFQRLVMAERPLKFPLYQGKTVLRLTEEGEDPNEETYRVQPGDLQTSKDPPDLERSLYRLNQLSRTSKEERGVNTLYLALGMLEWRPLEDAGVQKAPLLMVPVDLKREDHLHPYILSPFDENTEVNPTLIYMLRKDFDFAIPEFPDDPEDGSLETFFEALQKAVSGMGWLVQREAWLRQFQFKKLSMYRDLEEHESVASESSLITGVAGCSQFAEAPDIGSEDTFDEVNPAEVFTVLDADSSQLKAILQARAGQDLIIQGPPGTGKSQTITNLIAQFLYDGKKVLFVSEKVAALSVAYRRLEEVGLAPFCLELHSDKANKRDTLARIARAAQVGRQAAAPSTQVHLQFDTLLALRRELNEYARALHRPVFFGKSAFNLHAELAKLDQIPNIAATINVSVDDLSPERELSLLRQARKLSQMPDMLVNYHDHPWYGCLIDSWSMERQADLEAHLRRFRQALSEAAALTGQIAAQMASEAPSSIDQVSEFVGLAECFGASTAPPRHWLAGAPLQDLQEAASLMAERQRRHHELREQLLRHYSPVLFNNDCACLEESLNPPRHLLMGALRERDQKHDFLARNAAAIEAVLASTATLLSGTNELAGRLVAQMGDAPAATLFDAQRLGDIARLAGADPRPAESWLDWTSLTNALDNARESLQKQNRFTELRANLLSEFTDSFFALPLQEWRSDFRQRYTSLLRFLNSGYRRSMKAVRANLKVRSRVSFGHVRERIEHGAEVKELELWFEENRPDHARTLGVHFRGIETDWSAVIAHLETLRSILEQYGGSRPGEGLSQLLLAGGTGVRALGEIGTQIATSLESLRRTFDSLDQMIDVRALFGMGTDSDASLATLSSNTAASTDEVTRYQQALTALEEALRPGASRSPEEKALDAAVAREVAEIEQGLAGSREALIRDYGYFFDGVDTDWAKVITALDWSASFIRLAKSMGLDDTCLDAACSRERVNAMSLHLNELKGMSEKIKAERAYLVSVVDVVAIRPADGPLDTCSFDDLVGWLDVRLAHLGELSDWIQFQEVRRDCEVTGLHDFVEKVLEMKVPADTLEQALQKRLLVLQLDRVYAELPVLRTFQHQDHEDLVTRFKKLDRDLMQAYAQMIRARIAAGQPRLTGPAVGQFGFLRRELAKQRRHAPLRKLFQQCGNVILDLVPCLMMSPLSVATFLPKDSVQFDVVVFDEASQVPAEEAIGAILRGKQLIVAGDSKQLPPTRFFERSLDDGDDEYSEEAEEASLESLLDDCRVKMDDALLEWHYRSKHESLIAFSNAEFYGNSLITFPSPEDPPPEGLGVHFEYVQGAVYDRGKSRTNRKEAQRVVELIRRHLDSDRRGDSLGVIALSTSQENAILEEVERLINARPDLEQYLNPTGYEPFFVKPLENVQGDERDTIILSIGYGRAADGTLYLGFGPISQEGGERRLNVAVTRARREMILVSSLQPHDIDESKAQRAGPKILKRYLQFAKEGRLPPEVAAPTGESESEFEVAVWRALCEQGLDVDRQVGCSSYRIDLAIRDPKHPGRYLLGVECDGAPYHSSAVARDRDRLRQQVLEGLGWKIHRIWSTDWIRDPKGALKRLLYRIEELNNDDDPPSLDRLDDDEPDGDDDPGDDSPHGTHIELSSPVDPYVDLVSEHTDTPPSRRTRDDFYDGDDSDILEDIHRVVVHEGPIHEDLIVVRVARMYKLMRTGGQIEQIVRRQIRIAASDGQIRKAGPFLWPSSLGRVIPRRPGPGVALRRAEQVPPVELDQAALLVARLAGGITGAELVPEIARVLGYQRTGSNIERAAGDAIKRLLKLGALEQRGDFLLETQINSQPTLAPPPKIGEDRRSRDGQPASVGAAVPEVSQGDTVVDIPLSLKQIAQRHGLKLVDMRAKGGALWVIADSALGAELRPFGFQFARHGGKATGNEPAWFLLGKPKGPHRPPSTAG